MTETREEARQRIVTEILELDHTITVLQRVRQTLTDGLEALKE